MMMIILYFELTRSPIPLLLRKNVLKAPSCIHLVHSSGVASPKNPQISAPTYIFVSILKLRVK
jgi:hypothetical protein